MILKTCIKIYFMMKMDKISKIIAFAVVAFLVSFQNLMFYKIIDFQLFITLIFIPFVLYVRQKDKKKIRFGLFAILLLLFYPILKVQSLFFFGFVFFLLFLVEFTYGKLNNLPFFLMLLLSPLASFVFNTFGFPIRLYITELAYNILSFVYTDISFAGNIIYVGKESYKVAPECMGLNLLTTGFILTIYVISRFEKESKKIANFGQIISILFIALLLIIMSNLFRIVGIVIFKAAPETLVHELLGIFSLLVYVVLPIYIIIKKVFRFNGIIEEKQNFDLKKNETKNTILLFFDKYKFLIVSTLIILLLAILNFFRDEFRNNSTDKAALDIEMQGFEKEIVNQNIIQFKNQSTLIYIKPSVQFYGADHTPIICWKGSGYEFSEEKIIHINEYEIYFSVLTANNGENLYTAWWYDNGKHKTISQLEWRWKMLLGSEPYRLVNVTCVSHEELKIETSKMLGYNLFD